METFYQRELLKAAGALEWFMTTKWQRVSEISNCRETLIAWVLRESSLRTLRAPA